MIIFILLVFCFFGGSISIEAQDRSTGKLVNRRVLLLDFVNQKNTSDSNYLSVSIPEAFINPLQKTKSFEVMSRDLSSRIVKKKKIDSSKLFSDDNAVILGKAAGADVVVIGNYIVIGNSIQIQAKAIDTFSGRVKVSQSATGKLDSSIFTTIKILAIEMSTDMKRELPPLAQKEIIKERIVFKTLSQGTDGLNRRLDNEKLSVGDNSNHRLRSHILGSFNLPIGQIADYFDNSFGVKVDASLRQEFKPLLLPISLFFCHNKIKGFI